MSAAVAPINSANMPRACSPACSAATQSNRPADQRPAATSYASLAGAQPTHMVAVLR
jgi:hypothetical protein